MIKKYFDWNNFSGVRLTFWVIKPFDNQQVAQSFLEILEDHALKPNQINIGWEKDRFVSLKKHLDDYYRNWLKVRPKQIGKFCSLRHTKYPIATMNLDFDITGNIPFDFLTVELESEYFHESSHQQQFLQMGQDIYDLINPAYGKFEYGTDRLWTSGPIDLECGLPGIFFANFLGPEYSDLIGWDKLDALEKSLPVRVIHLHNDGVLIILDGNVLDSETEKMLARAEEVERFLGEEYFSKTQVSHTVPFSMEDAIAEHVPKDILRKYLLPPKPKQGKVPKFRFRELRRQRQEEWEKSGGMTVDEIIADLGLELKGPGGIIVVDAKTGKGTDLPGEMFEES